MIFIFEKIFVRVFVCTRNTPRIADAFQSRKAYFLRIELLDLNMLSEKVRDGFVRVEASIGNIGNVKEQPVSAVCFVCCVCALYVVCVCVCVYVLCMLCVCVCACLFVSLPPPMSFESGLPFCMRLGAPSFIHVAPGHQSSW